MAQAVEGVQKLLREAEKTQGQGAEHVRVWAHFKLGDVYLTIDGRTERARREYQTAHDLSRQLADADLTDAQAQRDLSVSHGKLGDVLLRQGEGQQALTHYQDGLTIRQRLADADPKDAEAQRNLSISHNNIGNVLLQQGEVQPALKHYQEYHMISQRLADADP